MKRYRSHLFYLALIIAVGLFYWQRLKSENQRIALLNRTTDETMVVARLNNETLLKGIRKEAFEYPSPRYTALASMALKADSLLRSCDANPAGCDSLPGLLQSMVNKDWRPPDFRKALRNHSKNSISPVYQALWSQHDSLRRQWAFLGLLLQLEDQMGRVEMRFDAYQPAISCSTICPIAGNPVENDIVLSRFCRPYTLQMSINGQPHETKEDLAHFVHTYPAPGVYPLHVKAEVRNFDSDSLIVAEKTFHLHVSQ